MSFKSGTSNFVIINSPAIAHELLDKRGAIYSNRPEMYVLRNYVFSQPEDKAVSILQYDEFYRRWRKSFHSILSNSGIKRVIPLLEAEASTLAYSFVRSGPDKYIDTIMAWSLAVPLVATTGQRLSDLPESFAEEFFQKEASQTSRSFQKLCPRSY